MNVRAVARGWWIVVITAALAVAAAYLYSLNVPDRYQSRGTYVIGPSGALTEPEAIVRSFDSLQGQGIVPTLVELLSSKTIAQEVGAGLGIGPGALEQYELRASVLSDSNTLELAATGPDPRLTAALTRGVGERASTVFEDLYSVYEIRPLDQPAVPEDRYSPQPVRNMVLALLLGLTAGGGLALLRARLLEGGATESSAEPASVEASLGSPSRASTVVASSPQRQLGPAPSDRTPREPSTLDLSPSDPTPSDPTPSDPSPPDRSPSDARDEDPLELYDALGGRPTLTGSTPSVATAPGGRDDGPARSALGWPRDEGSAAAAGRLRGPRRPET